MFSSSNETVHRVVDSGADNGAQQSAAVQVLQGADPGVPREGGHGARERAHGHVPAAAAHRAGSGQ